MVPQDDTLMRAVRAGPSSDYLIRGVIEILAIDTRDFMNQ